MKIIHSFRSNSLYSKSAAERLAHRFASIYSSQWHMVARVEFCKQSSIGGPIIVVVLNDGSYVGQKRFGTYVEMFHYIKGYIEGAEAV